MSSSMAYHAPTVDWMTLTAWSLNVARAGKQYASSLYVWLIILYA